MRMDNFVVDFCCKGKQISHHLAGEKDSIKKNFFFFLFFKTKEIIEYF